MRIWLSILLDIIRYLGAYIPVLLLPSEYWYLKILSFICILSFIKTTNELRGERDFLEQALTNYQNDRYKMLMRKEQSDGD